MTALRAISLMLSIVLLLVMLANRDYIKWAWSNLRFWERVGFAFLYSVVLTVGISWAICPWFFKNFSKLFF